MLATLSVPLFDPAAVPSPRPCPLASPPRADAVKVGRRANHATMSDFARPHLDGGEHGGRLAWVGQKTIRRSGTAKLEPAMLSTSSQPCAHGCIVPSSRSRLLYNVREWERERPSHAVTAAPSNCVNELTWTCAASPQRSADSTASWWHSTHVTASERTPSSRMLPRVIGGPGAEGMTASRAGDSRGDPVRSPKEGQGGGFLGGPLIAQSG